MKITSAGIHYIYLIAKLSIFFIVAYSSRSQSNYFQRSLEICLLCTSIFVTLTVTILGRENANVNPHVTGHGFSHHLLYTIVHSHVGRNTPILRKRSEYGHHNEKTMAQKGSKQDDNLWFHCPKSNIIKLLKLII